MKFRRLLAAPVFLGLVGCNATQLVGISSDEPQSGSVLASIKNEIDEHRVAIGIDGWFSRGVRYGFRLVCRVIQVVYLTGSYLVPSDDN